jgi:hypothetical protein
MSSSKVGSFSSTRAEKKTHYFSSLSFSLFFQPFPRRRRILPPAVRGLDRHPGLRLAARFGGRRKGQDPFHRRLRCSADARGGREGRHAGDGAAAGELRRFPGRGAAVARAGAAAAAVVAQLQQDSREGGEEGEPGGAGDACTEGVGDGSRR